MFLNLTTNNATPEQITAGLEELPEHLHNYVRKLLTFDTGVELRKLHIRAQSLATLALAEGADRVLIDCELFFVSAFESELRVRDITPTFSHIINGKFEGWVDSITHY